MTNGTLYQLPPVERHEEPLRAMPVMDARLDREDAANQQMRKAGRTKWNRADANLAAEMFEKVYGNEALELAKKGLSTR